MIVRATIAAALALLLLISCTAAVRYSDKPGTEPYRPQKQEEHADDNTVARTDPASHTNKTDSSNNSQYRIPRGQNTQLDRERMNRIVADYLGTSYSRGGTGRMGIDCSGLLYVLYRDYDGTRLPLSTEALYRLDKRIDFDDLTYGDLVFFRLSGRKVSHVGMYLENARFVHASESRGVTVDELTTEYFATSYAGARRVR